MAFEVEKVIIHDNHKFPMHDFGMYNFLRYSDNVNKAKFVSTVIDNKYVAAVDLRDKIAHWELVQKINNEVGEFDFHIGSLGDELYVWKMKHLTYTELYVMLKILEEVKQYYLDTGISKYIEISCDDFGNELKCAHKSEDIDYAIDVVQKKIEDLEKIEKGNIKVAIS